MFAWFHRLWKGKPELPREQVEGIVEHLVDMGYLKFVAPDQRGRVRDQLVDSLQKHQCLETDWDEHCDGADRRIYSADNEELAEGRIGEHLLRMKPPLEQEGVLLRQVQDQFSEDDRRYEIKINERPNLVYADAEMDPNIWATATKRFAEILNELLIGAGSSERAYLIYGGNDGRVILLTEEMYDYLCASDAIMPDSMPYPPSQIVPDQESV